MKKILITLFSVLFGTSFAFSTLQLNEIRIDQSGTDDDEYFEITGDPGESLDGVWYVVLGDHSGQDPNPPSKGSGTIEFATSLDGLVIPDSGFFLGTAFSFTLNATPTAQFFDLIFENNDTTTHMIVRGYTGPIVEVQAEQEGDLGVTIDLNDDGVIDVDPLPWTEVIDAVAVTEPGGEEFPYGAALGGFDVPPNGTFTAAHIYRSSITGQWIIGAFSLTDPAAADTPGAENPAIGVSVLINEVRIDQSGDDNDEFFELKGNAGDSLDGLTYLVIGDDGTGQGLGSGFIEFALNLDGSTIPENGFFVAAKSTFTLDADAVDLTVTDFNFEGSDNVTHLVVRGYTGPEIVDRDASDALGANAIDLDADDDGVIDLDPLPWDQVVDAVSLVESVGSGDQVYAESLGGDNIGPDGSFVPAHVYRNGETDAWQIGLFSIPDASAPDSPGVANPGGLAITGQPQSVTINSGESADLTITTVGPGPLVFQWYKGDTGDTSTPVADPSIPGESDLDSTITFFNGNDALSLSKNGVIIDVIGVIGNDPGSSGWGSGDATTSEHTIVRKSSVTQGDADGFTGNETDITGEWNGFPQNTFKNLGSHSADSQATDLFFSEYIEGSGNNKAVEIFNGTGAAVDLSLYVVERYTNGASASSDTLTLSTIQAMLNDGEVLVLGNDGADGPNAEFNTPALTETTSYWVRVSNDTDSVDSDTATVTVEGTGALDVFGGVPIDGFPGWRASSWYLNYNVEFLPWIFHDEHGWQFVFDGSTTDVIFLFDLDLNNWIFLNESTYRWEFLFGPEEGWIFTFANNVPGSRFFQRLDDGSIFSLPAGL